MNAPVLQHLRSRLALWQALRTVLLVTAAAGGAALALVLLDGALDLSDAARLSAPVLLIGSAMAVLAAGFWRWRQMREERIARLFELAEPSLGNRLINAVQLSRESREQGIEEYLRREAVELGRATAAGLNVWPAISKRMKMAAAACGLVVAVWLCLVFVNGELLREVMPRFLDPRGDHPPYSRLKIEVTPRGTEILYGGQVEVRAQPKGRPTDKLWLVAKAGTNATRTIMFLAPDKTFFQTLANLRQPAEYFVTDGQARSRRFPINIRYTPQITLVEMTTVFPEYTGKPAHTGKLTEEPQALPEDTKVSFRLASNRPLKSGTLQLTPVMGGKPTHLELKPETENHLVSGCFTLTEPVIFTLSVKDVNDLESAESTQGRINILPDERPRIFVLEPGRDAVATPSTSVPVVVQATDDYGISRMVWLRGHNRSIERPFSMKIALKNGPQSVEAAGAFEFQKLGVRPGDVIEYYFEAADNYPKGPNVALSRLYRLQIISPEQYEAILKQAAARKALFEPYFKLGAWLQRLAERARNLQKQAESSNAADKQAAPRDGQALAEELAKYERESGNLLQQATMFDIEQSFRNTLVEQHTGVSLAAKKLREALGSGQLDPKQAAEVAEGLSKLAQTEQEELDQPGREIAEVARILARADTFVKLAQTQATLAQMLRRFADQTNSLSRVEQIEMQELTHQQQRIGEGLADLVKSLPDLLAMLPEDEKYDPLRNDVKGFVNAVTEAQIQADLENSAKALGNLDGPTGAPLAQSAAEKMDRLIARCNSLPKKGEMCLALRFQPKIQKALGNTLEQILAAMGANSGGGEGGRDGYALFNEDVALYGPNMELAGEQAGGRQERSMEAGRRSERLPGNAKDDALKAPETSLRVRLQPDAKFPLRYREVVGEYFRVIAESENEEGGKK